MKNWLRHFRELNEAVDRNHRAPLEITGGFYGILVDKSEFVAEYYLSVDQYVPYYIVKLFLETVPQYNTQDEYIQHFRPVWDAENWSFKLWFEQGMLFAVLPGIAIDFIVDDPFENM